MAVASRFYNMLLFTNIVSFKLALCSEKQLAYFKGYLCFADHALRIMPYGINLQVLIKSL